MEQTKQNKELEQARRYFEAWNKRRELAEKKGLEYFYKLKALFNQQKTKP